MQEMENAITIVFSVIAVLTAICITIAMTMSYR